MRIEPVVLDGVSVRLEPLSMDHRSHLTAVGCDPELWRWTVSLVRTPADMEGFLMLRHAFETWACLRVEFKTDVLNAPSRQALLRIGAKEEIQWPGVKAALEAKLR